MRANNHKTAWFGIVAIGTLALVLALTGCAGLSQSTTPLNGSSPTATLSAATVKTIQVTPEPIPTPAATSFEAGTINKVGKELLTALQTSDPSSGWTSLTILASDNGAPTPSVALSTRDSTCGVSLFLQQQQVLDDRNSGLDLARWQASYQGHAAEVYTKNPNAKCVAASLASVTNLTADYQPASAALVWRANPESIASCLTVHVSCVTGQKLLFPNSLQTSRDPKFNVLGKLYDAGICTDAVADADLNTCNTSTAETTISAYSNDSLILLQVATTSQTGGPTVFVAGDGWMVVCLEKQDKNLLIKVAEALDGTLIEVQP